MHAVRFRARVDGRIDDVEPRLGTDMTVLITVRPSPGPDGRVPGKHIHRWLNDGGAVLPRDGPFLPDTANAISPWRTAQPTRSRGNG